MHRIKAVGPCACLFVVLAACGMTAQGALASGSPEWMTCFKAAKEGKTYSGKYSDKACSDEVTSGGKYELGSLEHLKKTTMSTKSGPVTLQTPALAAAVDCKSMTATAFVRFWTRRWWIEIGKGNATSCVASDKASCTSAGEKKGTIALSPLMGWVVPLSEGRPGVILKPEEGALASFECEGLAVKVSGSVLGVISGDVNTISKTATWTFSTHEGKQEPTTYEGSEEGPNVLLSEIDGSGPFESGMSAVVTVKSEAMEVKT
jgi:hypothetical protein